MVGSDGSEIDYVYRLYVDDLRVYGNILHFYWDIRRFFCFRGGDRHLYREIETLQANSSFKISFSHGRDLAPLELSDIFLDYSQDIPAVARQLNDLFTTTLIIG